MNTQTHTNTHTLTQANTHSKPHSELHFSSSPPPLPPSLPPSLPPALQSGKDNEGVEKVMNDLDANNDGEVDFTEFIILMGALTVACNDFFLDVKPEDKPKE